MTTKSDKLRAMMLERPDLFDALRLTKKEREVVMWVKGHGQPCGSHAVANHVGGSLQSACVVLKACYDKGYLKRRNIGDKTGGTQWAYVYALGGDV